MTTTSHIYKVHGIVLKRRNVGEADRIITLFTKESGKIRVIGKGIRRINSRRASHLEVFRLVSVALHKGKALDSICEVQSSPLLDILPHQVQKVSFAYYLCELVDRLLPEHQEHADVFHLMQEAFVALNTTDTAGTHQRTLWVFALELLWLLGYLPRSTQLSQDSIQPYIEGIIERKLRTPKLIGQFG